MGYYVSWASHLPPFIGEKTKAREVKTLCNPQRFVIRKTEMIYMNIG